MTSTQSKFNVINVNKPFSGPRRTMHRPTATRSDVYIPTQRMLRLAEEKATKQRWAESNEPRAFPLEVQQKALLALVAEAHRFHRDAGSSTLEAKSEMVRKNCFQGSACKMAKFVKMCKQGSQLQPGISTTTARMLEDDIAVIFRTYEDPFAVGKKALQTYGLWYL